MPETRKCRFVPTSLFTPWLNGMDSKTLGRILKRLDDAKNGNFGDIGSVGEGVFEMRLHFGPGYRIYYCRIDNESCCLLCGGDKSTQTGDVRLAKGLKKTLERRHGR